MLLFKERRSITTRLSRSGEARLSHIAFLYRLYAPRMWWLSIVDLFRRLMLSSLLMLISNTTGQLAWALAVSIVFAAGFKEIEPYYESSSDELFQATCWVLIWCIVGLLLRDLAQETLYMDPGGGSKMYMDDGAISAVLVRHIYALK